MRAAVAVAIATAVVAMAAPSASADPLPGGLGPCLGSDCPATWDDPNSDPVAHHDSNVNIYVGGDYLVREAASEAEGKIVTLGTFDMDKREGVSAIYNVGVAGVGSRVPPPNGSDYLTVGGDVTVAPDKRLLAEEGTNSGKVAYGGTLTGTVNPLDAPRKDPDAITPFTALRDQLTEASHCYAYEGTERRAATGTWARAGDTTTFTGDGTSAIQIFDVDADLVPEAVGDTDFVFAGIPAGATVLVNVYGTSRSISSLMGSLPTPGLREHLLWNFPDATSLTLSGTAQFQGSILVGQQSSTTTLRMTGTNGRFYTAGSLTHTSPSESGGQELHAYPFDGDLPSCEPEPTPTPTPTDPTPTPTDPTPTPTPTDPTPSPTDPTPTPTDPEPSPSATTPAPVPSPSRSGGQLPDTGSRGGEWVMGSLAAGLVAAGGAAFVAARRARRRSAQYRPR